MKQLDKNGVAIKLTEKKLKKIYKTLKMFPQEKINPTDEVLLRTGKFPSGVTLSKYIEDLDGAFLHFDEDNWRVDVTTEGKLTVKHKQLRNILYAEHCKEGDYVVIKSYNDKFICKVKELRQDGFLSTYYDIDINQVDRLSDCSFEDWNFTRYAIQEEIDLLEGTKEKMAVRVDNEKEFNALMKYYDSLGWRSRQGLIPFNKKLLVLSQIDKLVSFNDGFVFPNTSSTSAANPYDIDYEVYNSTFYKIIPFSEFAKEHGIRVPRLTTFDGVDVFDGDTIAVVNLKDHNKGNRNFLINERDTFDDWLGITHYAFSTEQVALDWIEAQKPKNTQIPLYFGETAVINQQESEITIGTLKLSFGVILDIKSKMEYN